MSAISANSDMPGVKTTLWHSVETDLPTSSGLYICVFSADDVRTVLYDKESHSWKWDRDDKKAVYWTTNPLNS